MRPPHQRRAQARSTTWDARFEAVLATARAAGTRGSRVAPPPWGLVTGRRGWRRPSACPRRAAVEGANHLYAIAIGSNRPHGRYGRPPQVVETAIARLDQDFGLFDASPIVLNRAVGGAGR